MPNANYEKIKQQIKTKFSNQEDLLERTIYFSNAQISLYFMSELVNVQYVYQSIIMPLQDNEEKIVKDLPEQILKKSLFNGEVEVLDDLNEGISKILKGFVLLVFNSSKKMLAVNAEKILVRAIETPPTSTVIKGPREGFNESIKQNLSLVRKRLASEKMTVQFFEVGKYTKTQVAVAFVKNIADDKIVKKICERIQKIDIGGVIDSYYISTFLQDRPNSMFKQIGDTEKPDIFVAKLLEGRIGIIVDGSPIALTLPYILLEDLQDSNDYYQSHTRVWFVRVLRLVGVLIAILLPATYVALQLYHYKIIPTMFLVTILNTTKGIPFSPFSEVVFVILLFEILYEANLRMPQYLGLALSIVGALILGETAVQAGLVSPPAVMIVALSGLTYYTIPNLAGQFSLMRIIFVFFAGILGLYGVLLCSIFTISYLSSFDSYGSAYLGPLAPYIASDQKDFIFKENVMQMRSRPKSISRANNTNRDKND